MRYQRANIIDDTDAEILSETVGFAPGYIKLHMPYISFLSYWLCEIRAKYYHKYRSDKSNYFTIRHHIPLDERREFDLSFIYHLDNHPKINTWSVLGFTEIMRSRLYMNRYRNELFSVGEFFKQEDFTETELNFFRRYTKKYIFDTKNEHKDRLLYNTFHRGQNPKVSPD